MNHSPAGSYSNATTPRSSLTSSTSVPGTPRTNSDGLVVHSRQTVARASVFDAYFQLGMFEENSPLAAWVFDDGKSASSSSTTYCGFPSTDADGSSSQACRFREKSGSRFRERLDSDSPIFVLNNWKDDDRNGGSPHSSKKSKKSKPSGRSMATQQQNSIRFASSTTALRQQRQSNTPRRSFSIFRTRTSRISSTSDISEVEEDVPATPKKKGSRKPPLSRAQTHPPPVPSITHHDVDTDHFHRPSPLRRPSTTSSSDWEKIDPLSSFDFNTLASTDNTFLHGPQRPKPKSRPNGISKEGAPTDNISSSQLQIPFPSTSPAPLSPTLMQRLSAVVTRPFHLSSRGQHDIDSHKRAKVHSLRRTQSSVTVDTTAASSRPFLLSSPHATQLHRLTPSMSHS